MLTHSLVNVLSTEGKGAVKPQSSGQAEGITLGSLSRVGCTCLHRPSASSFRNKDDVPELQLEGMEHITDFGFSAAPSPLPSCQ